MTPLLRLLLVNGITGAVLALGFVTALLALDVGRLRTLMLADGQGAIALSLLAVGFVVMCCSVMMASAVMMMERGEPQDRGGARGEPAPVRVGARRR